MPMQVQEEGKHFVVHIASVLIRRVALGHISVVRIILAETQSDK